MSKTIGIPGWDIKLGEHFGVTIPYLVWASQFGKVIILSPDDYADVDLLVLPGGSDVDPSRYSQVPHFYTGRSNVFLEHFDKNILPTYVENNTPIFGICRGLQTLNVHFGGTLTQHLQKHPTSKDNNDLDEHAIHQVVAGKKSTHIQKVGSWHHQAVDTVGEGLIVNVLAEDGVVEGIVHSSKPIAAVQWHPERNYDEFSRNLVQQLLNSRR